MYSPRITFEICIVQLCIMKHSLTCMKQLFLPLLFLFAGSGCTDNANEPYGNNIIFGENIIGNGEQVFEIKDRQYLKRGTYLLKGWCYVTYGSVLTIEAGTVIKGDKETRAALIVEPGGTLIAKGTADAPIVFTSEMPAGQRKPGDWGGLIVCGYARNNKDIMQIEGGPRTMHGGPDNEDSSGILSYIRVEFAGYPFQRNREINGLTFGSVGSGTQVDHIQVSYANDDAFEWFGGTVDCRYLIAYHCWDDDFDADNGYSGTCSHLLAIRHPRIADITGSHAFECSNNGTDSPATPTTAALFENAVVYGPLCADDNFENTAGYINGGELRPDNESMPGLFGAALYLGENTRVGFRNCTVSGYPETMQGTPALAENIVFSAKAGVTYPEWTERWCNFDPQHTDY